MAPDREQTWSWSPRTPSLSRMWGTALVLDIPYAHPLRPLLHKVVARWRAHLYGDLCLNWWVPGTHCLPSSGGAACEGTAPRPQSPLIQESYLLLGWGPQPEALMDFQHLPSSSDEKKDSQSFPSCVQNEQIKVSFYFKTHCLHRQALVHLTVHIIFMLSHNSDFIYVST